jgi:hypothetical protein
MFHRSTLLMATALTVLPSLFFAAPLPVHEVQDLRYLGGGIADSFRGKIEGLRYAMKPLERFGQSQFGSFGQGNPEAELVCLPLMRELGLVAPESFLFRPGPEAPGVLAVGWVDEALAGGPVRIAEGFLNGESVAKVDSEAFALMFAADILVSNPDRHGGNFFIWSDENGVVRPIPIDHNLALFPDEPSGKNSPFQIDASAFQRSIAFSGALAMDESWGDQLVSAMEKLHARLTPEFVGALVDRVPEVVSQKRRNFLRKLLNRRRATLLEATYKWRSGWLPEAPFSDDLPPLIGRLKMIARWTPQGAVNGMWLFTHLLRKDPALEEAARVFLQLSEDVPAGAGLVSWLETRAEAWAQAVVDHPSQVKAQIQAYGGGMLTCVHQAQDFLARKTGLSRSEIYRRIVPTILDRGWNGRLDPINLFQGLLQADRQQETPLGDWIWLRAVMSMGEAFDGDAFQQKLARLRPLLGAYRKVIHGRTEESKLRLKAKMVMFRKFGRLVQTLVPEANGHQIEAALIQMLREYSSKDLKPREGKMNPGALALALRLSAANAGVSLSYEEFWSYLRDYTWLEKGVWIAGWGGPLYVNDGFLSIASLQRQGFHADSAARLLFERLAGGAYESWRDLSSRVVDKEILSRVLLPGSQGEPPPPQLRKGKGREVDWTAPAGSLWGEIQEGGEVLLLEVRVKGLEAMEVARIRIARNDSEQWVAAEDEEDLDLQEGQRLPQELLPR